jgi:hypothetical protein
LAAKSCLEPFQSTGGFGVEDFGWAEAIGTLDDCSAAVVDGETVPDGTFFCL